MPFKQMENVSQYLIACSALGVPAFETFQTVDLYENKNMMAVVTNLHALGRAAQRLPGYAGPVLGVKMAEANKRSFTAEQLAQAVAEPTRFGKGSHGGASQAGSLVGDSIVRTTLETGGLGTGGEPTLLGRGSSGTSSVLGGSGPSTFGARRDVAGPRATAEVSHAPAEPPPPPPAATAPMPDVSSVSLDDPAPLAAAGATASDQSPEQDAALVAGATDPGVATSQEAVAAEPMQPTAGPAAPSTPVAATPPAATIEPCTPTSAAPASGATYVRYEEREAEDGSVSYGLDRELAAKARAKYDPGLEAEARAWVEAVLEEQLGTLSFQEALKSGEVLCRLINALKPGSVRKIAGGSMPFKQMENVSQYLSACSALGVPAFETFQTVDLYENKNMMAVITNLHALGRAAQRLPGYAGPVLGAKMAEANKRSFTAEQLAQARAEPTLISLGSSKQVDGR